MDDQPVDLATAIGRVMGRVLLTEPLAADADFFERGGDSLRAVEVLQRLADDEGFGHRLGSAEIQAVLLEGIFEDATPAALATLALAHAG